MRVDTDYPAQPPVLLFPEPAEAASTHDAQVSIDQDILSQELACECRSIAAVFSTVVSMLCAGIRNERSV